MLPLRLDGDLVTLERAPPDDPLRGAVRMLPDERGAVERMLPDGRVGEPPRMLGDGALRGVRVTLDRFPSDRRVGVASRRIVLPPVRGLVVTLDRFPSNRRVGVASRRMVVLPLRGFVVTLDRSPDRAESPRPNRVESDLPPPNRVEGVVESPKLLDDPPRGLRVTSDRAPSPDLLNVRKRFRSPSRPKLPPTVRRRAESLRKCDDPPRTEPFHPPNPSRCPSLP